MLQYTSQIMLSHYLFALQNIIKALFLLIDATKGIDWYAKTSTSQQYN